jgi:PAS domain S-box-containing protein
LGQIIEFLPDPTFVIDAGGVIVAWNRAIERMTNLPRERMLGRGNHEYAIPFYGSRRPMLVDFCLQWNDAYSAHYEYVERENDILYGENFCNALYSGRGASIWGSARPLYDEAGRITGAIESIRDITGRRVAERAAIDWRRRYELVAAASGQITYEHSLNTGALLWNKVAEVVLGYQIHSVADWKTCIHPEDLAEVELRLGEALRGNTAFEAEYRMRHRNGAYLWFRDRAYPTVNAANQRCLIGMLADITAARKAEETLLRGQEQLEQRVRSRTAELATANALLRAEIEQREQTQRALASSEAKYRTMLDSLPQVVFEVDLTGRILLLNRQGYTDGGITPADLELGMNIADFISVADRQRMRDNFARLTAGEPVSGHEYSFVGRKGNSFPATTYARLILQDEHPVGVTGFLIDETPRHRAREILQKAYDKLEERVGIRTSELAASNHSLLQLLRKQEMNIQLAHKVLLLVNANAPRHVPLPGSNSLFIASHLMPRHVEGGDHVLVRNLTGGQRPRTMLSIKDQSGHEVGCILRSIITDLIHNSLLSFCDAETPIEDIATRLNQEIFSSHLFEDGEFFTAIDLELDHRTLQLRYVISGHPPFLLIRDGRATQPATEQRTGLNLPIGIISDQPRTAASLQLQPGDRLLLYTDGLLDAACLHGSTALPASELPALANRLLEAEPELRITTLATRLYELISGTELTQKTQQGLPDDLALLVLEIERPVPTVEESFRAADIAELGRERRALLERIQEEWARNGISASPARLQMVMEEALYNAWKHGCHSSPEGVITVRRSYGNDARLEVVDQGSGFDWSAVQDPTSPEYRLRPSGRGLYMIRRFADEAVWSDSGRHLDIFFSASPAFSPEDKGSPLHSFSPWPSDKTTNAS